MCIKTESEHYRRCKDKTAGGYAMGAIYWQAGDLRVADPRLTGGRRRRTTSGRRRHGRRLSMLGAGRHVAACVTGCTEPVWLQMLQYYAKNFFSPVLVSLWTIPQYNDMGLYIVSDINVRRVAAAHSTDMCCSCRSRATCAWTSGRGLDRLCRRRPSTLR